MDDETPNTPTSDGTVKSMSELDLRIKKAYQFKTSVLERLREQRNSREFCDLVLCAENEKFNVHKCVLVASSDYFEAMISRSGMQEATADIIELKDITANGLRTVLDFIYTGELTLSIENIAEVLRAVTHLQVHDAIKLCEDFLIEETTVENCIDVLSLADLFSIPVLEKINKFVLRNFPKVALNEGFKRLTYEQILYLIRSNEFRLYPEIKVFEMCVEWLKTDEENRLMHASSLMEHVRFQTMKPEEFNDLVMSHDFMRTDPACIQFAFEAYAYFSLPNRQFCSVSTRSKIRNEPSLVCVNESMYILNKHDDVWEYMCNSLATWRTLSQKFVVVNNFLYACGGYSENNRETTNACYRFDPRTGLWSEIARLCEKRQFFSLAGSNECLVAVGGVYGDKGNFYATHPCSTAIEVYNIEKDEWRTLACVDLPILKWPGACVAENVAFVIGGKHTDGLNHRLSENSYMVDLESGQVTICAPPLTVRFNPTVFYQNKRLILFGGEDDKYRLAPCIEMYDTLTNQWTEIATIPVSHSYQCISSSSIIGEKIHYLLEEHDGPSSESYILKSSYFDIEKRTFEKSVQLPHPSTLASKWCSLVFPQQFLDGCQAFDSHESHHHLHHHHHHHHPQYHHYPSDSGPRQSLGELSSAGDASTNSTNSTSNSPMTYQRHRYYPEHHHRTFELLCLCINIFLEYQNIKRKQFDRQTMLHEPLIDEHERKDGSALDEHSVSFSTNDDLKELCLLLDEERYKMHQLAEQWKHFGTSTIHKLEGQIVDYQEKLSELEHRQYSLLQENDVLRSMIDQMTKSSAKKTVATQTTSDKHEYFNSELFKNLSIEDPLEQQISLQNMFDAIKTVEVYETIDQIAVENASGKLVLKDFCNLVWKYLEERSKPKSSCLL